MELSGSTTISWANSISPTVNSPRTFSMCRFKKVRILRASSGNDSEKSQTQNEMIVSITGTTGFIGKRLVQRLHAVVNLAGTPVAVKDFPRIEIAEEQEWKTTFKVQQQS